MTSSRVRSSARSITRCFRPWGLAAYGVWLACGLPLAADDAPPAPSPLPSVAMPADDEPWVLGGSNSGSINGGARPPKSQPADVGGFGVNARLGHIAGEGVGRRESITFIELSPYITVDSLFVASDLRFLRTNTGELGGSAGAVVRRYLPGSNSIVGTNLFFDVDNTYGSQFQQVGFGFEWLSNRLDNRTNFYIPFGEDTKQVGSGVLAGSESFSGNNLYFSRFTDKTTVATGIDTMFTLPVAGRFAERINLEVSAGAYYFRPNDSRLRDFAGPKLRVDGSLVKRLLHMYVEATHDNVNDTLVSFGVDVNYWNRFDGEPRLGGNQYHRITEWTRRNWTMVAVNERAIDAGIQAIDPETGLPYFIEHVDTNADTLPGDGTFERPWTSLQTAQSSPPVVPGEIIYVHAGSVFNTPLVMNPGEKILGEGVLHPLVSTNSPDFIYLPGTGKAGGTPTFAGVTGTPVTLADGVTFAGFNISKTNGPAAVLADGIDSARLYGIRIEDVDGGSGVVIQNSTGRITLDDVNVLLANPADYTTGVDLDSFRVQGGNAQITYSNSLIENTIGRAVRITGAGGVVDMRSVTIDSDNPTPASMRADFDEGVIVQNSSAHVVFGGMNLVAGTVDLENISGDVTFTQPVRIYSSDPNAENPQGISFRVNGSSGNVTFLNSASLEIIDHLTGPAIDLRNISGTIRFDGDITVRADPTPGVANFLNVFNPALVWQENSGTFIANGNFTAADLLNGFANQSQGILIGDRLGVLINEPGSVFQMNGQFLISGTYDTDGVTTSANSAIEILNDPTHVTFAGGIIRDRNATPPPTTPALPLAPTGGIEILNTTGRIAFNGTTEIFNEENNTNSTFAPLLVNGATGDVIFDRLTIYEAQDSTAHANASAVQVAGSRTIYFNELNVEYFGTSGITDNTAAVDIRDTNNVIAKSGILQTENAVAISLIDNGQIDWTSTSITASDDIYGIFVSDSPGKFTVTGVGDTLGSGGVISMNFTTGFETGAIFLGSDQNDAANIVNLNNMIFNNNDGAIVVRDYNQFILGGSRISSTTVSDAVYLDNVPNVLVRDSLFIDNAFTHFLAEISEDAGEVYDYIFERNQFIDINNFGGASMVQIDNFDDGAGAKLNLIVRDHGGRLSGLTGFISGRFDPMPTDVGFPSDSAAFDVRWNGAAQVLVNNNSFILQGGAGAKGFEFINADTSSLTTFVYNQNILENAITSTGTTGLYLDIAGQTDLLISNNYRSEPGREGVPGMRLNGLGDQAYMTRLRSGGNRVVIENNLVEFGNDNGVAFNFPFVGGNTNYTINGNKVQFLANSQATAPGERGFVFGPVTGILRFFGNINNEVLFDAPDVFSDDFAPNAISGSIGSFLLNGRRVPNP